MTRHKVGQIFYCSFEFATTHLPVHLMKRGSQESKNSLKYLDSVHLRYRSPHPPIRASGDVLLTREGAVFFSHHLINSRILTEDIRCTVKKAVSTLSFSSRARFSCSPISLLHS
ncbi:uncharacterized protein ACDP82_004459 isoform 2-T3 [Pangshura tecta]